jgi:FkbM family methyltransferase
VGSEGDGGYLIPKLDTEYDLVISGGIESNSDFETELATAGALVRAADYSIPKFPTEHPNIQFFKQYLSDATFQDKLVSLNDLIGSSFNLAKNSLLKLDIEGSEWLALQSIEQATLSKFSTLVIEFHWLENAANTQALGTINEVFSKILMDFDLVHVHPNNNARSFMLYQHELPGVFEATFLNKRLNGHSAVARELNTFLDKDNNPDAKTLGLSKLWFEI